MTPMPVNPKLVILVDEEGTLLLNRTNIVNDTPLEIVVCYSHSEFKHASLGLPYTGNAVLIGDEKDFGWSGTTVLVGDEKS